MERDTFKLSTIGGTLFSITMAFDASDLVRTAVLAAVGTVSSFFVTLGLRWILGRWKGGEGGR